MAAPTNTLITNNAVGNRESLHNIISILNKDETPFQAAIGSGSPLNRISMSVQFVEIRPNGAKAVPSSKATTPRRRRSCRPPVSATARRS